MADIFLQIISGTQVGRKIQAGNGLTIGRNTENIVCFSGPDGTLVSSKHAIIEKRGDILFLKDVGSTNGTFVNGDQIFEHHLQADQVISLGVNGPKLRVLAGLSGANAPQRSIEINPTMALQDQNSPLIDSSGGGLDNFGRAGDDAGNYTIGLAQRLKDDKAWWWLGSVSGIAVIIVGVLVFQNLGYRGKVKQQENLLYLARALEFQIAEAKDPGSVESAEDKAGIVAKLRAAERQLMRVSSNLKSSDVISTYKIPLGAEIQVILAGFGKRDYIVPDIFINQVQKHINTFTKTSSRAILERSFANSHKYKKIIENELKRQGMPFAFFYLSMHESLLDSAIVSKAGARGLWQFMPQTAREYGLRVPENWVSRPAEEDQRTNPRLATQAGVKYVKTLYAEFGDVALAMAAYSAGEDRIRNALRSIDDPINNRDFWYIYRLGTLAEETNEYVPKIIATMIIDKNHSRYGFGE